MYMIYNKLKIKFLYYWNFPNNLIVINLRFFHKLLLYLLEITIPQKIIKNFILSFFLLVIVLYF